MAKRRYKKARRSGKKKLPLTIAVPVGVPIYRAAMKLVDGATPMDATYQLMAFGPAGFDKNKAIEIAAPIIGGIVAHKVVGRYVNRYLPSWLPVSI